MMSALPAFEKAQEEKKKVQKNKENQSPESVFYTENKFFITLLVQMVNYTENKGLNAKGNEEKFITNIAGILARLFKENYPIFRG
jgi:hypothetical protein